MTVQSTSQVPFSSLEGKADTLLSRYQLEAAIYTYECWPGVSFALHVLEGIAAHSLNDWIKPRRRGYRINLFQCICKLVCMATSPKASLQWDY